MFGGLLGGSDSRIKFKFTLKMNQQVPKIVERWSYGILARTGAYGRGVMKKQIRPAPKGKRGSVVVAINPFSRKAGIFSQARSRFTFKFRSAILRCRVPNDPQKLVTDDATGRPVPTDVAWEARRLARRIRLAPKSGGGHPPRSRTGKLRSGILFAVDKATESVVIGVQKFAFQPAMQNRVSVPELLNKGGFELLITRSRYLDGEWVKYASHPYVETVQGITFAKMQSFIRERPLDKVRFG